MINFLKGKIALNCLCGSKENAKEILDATEGHAVYGILTSAFDSAEAAIQCIKDYQDCCGHAASVGLGAGNPAYWLRVAQVSAKIQPAHINQVFSAVGFTRALVGEAPWINCLIQPSGQPGSVIISTGEFSSKAEEAALVPVRTAVLMAKEMGANAVKFFPMKGEKALEEVKVLATHCAALGIAVEPTGGLDLENFLPITQAILKEGVHAVIPHVYSSIIDKESGQTRIEDVQKIYHMMQELA